VNSTIPGLHSHGLAKEREGLVDPAALLIDGGKLDIGRLIPRIVTDRIEPEVGSRTPETTPGDRLRKKQGEDRHEDQKAAPENISLTCTAFCPTPEPG